MITVLSIGISEYINDALNISCAEDDARKVYSTLQNITYNNFQEHTSVCLSNISDQQFLCIIDALKVSINDTDAIFILYFSGHAKFINNDLTLFFTNYHNQNGMISINILLEKVRTIAPKIIVILDCCESSEATKIANLFESENQICVLASCKKYGNAKYDQNGSLFTNALCKALQRMDCRNHTISIVDLADEIIRDGYSDLSVNIGASENGNLIIKSSLDFERDYEHFSKKFISFLKTSDSLVREAMWYSLVDIPILVSGSIYKEYFKVINENSLFFPEASWLVRRAIGSSLSHFDDLHNISESLLHSPFWQEQCIGIIGLRYLIAKDNRLFELLSKLIKNKLIKKIDAIWLANLYMSEHPHYDYKLFYDTYLVKSFWGQFELYKTMTLFYGSASKALNKLKFSDDVLTKIDLFEHFKNSNDNSNKLFSAIHKQNPRGRLPVNVKAKFLLSMLYGTWRGQTNLELRNYFTTTDEKQITSELLTTHELPCVEHKMALYDYFWENPELFIKYEKFLMWGLEDIHPWVRRAAIKAYKSINCDENVLYNSVIDVDYLNPSFPGLLDIVLECPKKYKKRLEKYIKQKRILPDWEIDSAFKNI